MEHLHIYQVAFGQFCLTNPHSFRFRRSGPENGHEGPAYPPVRQVNENHAGEIVQRKKNSLNWKLFRIGNKANSGSFVSSTPIITMDRLPKSIISTWLRWRGDRKNFTRIWAENFEGAHPHDVTWILALWEECQKARGWYLLAPF